MNKKLVYTLLLFMTLNILVYLIFIYNYSQVLHWFLIPTFILSNILIYLCITSFFKSKYSYFSVYFIVYLFSYYFFTIVPVLTVIFDFYIHNVIPPSDWRTWIGYLSLLNLLGVTIFVLIQKTKIFNFGFRTWSIDYKKFVKLSIFTLVLTFLLQTFYYFSVGGFTNFINMYTNRYESNDFTDSGYVFIITESFPIVFGILMIVIMMKKNVQPKWIILSAFLFLIFLLRMYFGGLRGSRSNTIWAVFWIIALLHMWVRPVSWKIISLGVIAVFLFMNIYSLYKTHGENFYEVFVTNEDRISVLHENQRGTETILLQDFGRTDIQAYTIYKLAIHDEYQYAFGETYLGTLNLLLPSNLNPFEIERKAKFGTNLLYGEGTYSTGFTSTKVYGLYGEAMLNFGVIIGLASFVFWGITVNFINHIQNNLYRFDVRVIMLPLLLITSILLLINDSDNVLFFLIKNGLIPFLLILLSKKEL